MKLFYIENTIDEHNSRINGYFSTLEKAKEGLKDCCDWNRENGTGKIYLVDIDVVKAEPILVCEDGKVARSYYSSISIADLDLHTGVKRILMREGIRTLDDFSEDRKIPAKHIIGLPAKLLKEKLAEYCIYITFPCEHQNEPTGVVEDLLADATARSKNTVGNNMEDLNKLKTAPTLD